MTKFELVRNRWFQMAGKARNIFKLELKLEV